MQKIFNNQKFKACAFMVIITVICLMAATLGLTASLSNTNAEIVADAATAVTASNFQSVIRNNGNAGTVSGTFELNSNISLAVNSGRSIATFSGTFDGKGHTITITTGNVTHQMSANVVDQYVGFFFGTLSGTIKNVNIVLNGSFNAKASNDMQTSADYISDNNATLYVGVIAGYATSAAKIEDVSFTIGNDGVVGGIGIDGNTSDHKRHGNGQGAVVGGMIGRSAGATLKNITFTNNGSVWARGQNTSAGQGNKGMVISLNNPQRGDRAAAGGMIGEIEKNTTTITSLVFKGNGYVGAWTYGGGSSSNAHNTNMAGGIIGYTYGGQLTITGVLYSYEGIAYVKEPFTDGVKRAGTILGFGTNVTVNSLWRRTDDNSSNSGVGQNTAYASDNAGPLKSAISNNTTGKTTIGTGTITTVSTCISSSLTMRSKEYKATIYYNGSADASRGSAWITDIKNGCISITATANNSSYIISAADYNLTANGTYTTKNYYTEAQSQNALFSADKYSIPVNCNDFRVHLATMTKSLYVNCGGSKDYNGYGVEFTGAPTETSPTLLPKLFWASEHDSNPAYNTKGALGSTQVTTNPNVGTYTMVLYKENADGTFSKVQDGESLGPNQVNAPSIIYQYDASKQYQYTISRAAVELASIPGASYQREYNGNAAVDGTDLQFDRHYRFYLAGTTTIPNGEVQFTIGAGYFYNAQDMQDGSVGKNKTVKITGITVYGNYQLSASSQTALVLNNCEITKKAIAATWNTDNLVYNGSIVTPTISSNDYLEGDSVTFTITAYADMFNYGQNNPITDKTNASIEYIAVATINNPNYVFKVGTSSEEAITVAYQIAKKEVALTWTPFEKVFNYSDQTVTCDITNRTSVIASGDDVNVIIKYYNADNVETALRNAGKYTAEASIDNPNYAVNDSYLTYDKIEILPIQIDIVFYTGDNRASNTVDNLVYMGATYIDHPLGLHAKIHPNFESYGLIDSNIALSYEDEVKKVGSYTATASFVESSENSQEDIIISNYAVNSQNNTKTVIIIQREITLEYGDEAFDYDGTKKTIDATISDGCIVGGDSVQVRKKEYIMRDSGEKEEINPIDAGSYIVEYSLSDDNYVITAEQRSRNLRINPYNIRTGYTNGSITIDAVSNQTYNGKAITPMITIRHNGQMLQTVNYDVNYDNNTNSGTAHVTIIGKVNYTDSITTSFVIDKKELRVEFIDASPSLTYDGENRSVRAQFTGYAQENDSVPLNITYSSDDGQQVISPKLVGKYTATVDFSVTSMNYKLSDDITERQFKFEIIPKTINLLFSGWSGLVYNGSQQSINVAFADGAIHSDDLDKVSLSLKYTYAKTGRTVEGLPRNADSYVATAILEGDAMPNYEVLRMGDGDNYTFKRFEIAKYTLKIIYDNATRNFDYTAKPITVNYSISDETPSYDQNLKISLSFTDSANRPIIGAPVNAGDYYVEAKPDSTNYIIAPDTATTSVNIAKAPLKIKLNMQENATFTYEMKKIDIDYAFIDERPKENDGTLFELLKSYYDENNSPIDECINVGTYRIKLELPTTSVAQNYYLTNAEEIYDNQTFSITPRYISVDFDNKGIYTYSGEEYRISASPKDRYGYVYDDGGQRPDSGLMITINGSFESVPLVVETRDENGNIVEFARNVGTYTSSVSILKIEDKNDKNYYSSINYVIYEDEKEYPTTSTLTITPKNITFIAKNTSKVYGNSDDSVDFNQILGEDITGVEGEEVAVRLIRSKPDGRDEIVGDYGYSGFEYDDAESNFNISFAASADQGKFTITQRIVYFSPNIFYFDYLSPIENLVHVETVSTYVFGNIEVRINLVPISVIITAGIDRGEYDLSTTFSCDNENFRCIMVEDSNKGKIVVLGRSVTVNIPDIYITYGDREPNYYDYIQSVNYDACDESIQKDYNDYVSQNGSAVGFDWSKYIRITREAFSSSLQTEFIPYRETGYKLTIEFLKKNALGNYDEVDDNYRAVDANGENVSSKLYIQKFDLNTVFGDNLLKPQVEINKNYDGKVNASVLNANIPDRYAAQTLSVYAEYENATAGTGKTITVKYGFRVTEYARNYILPNDIVLSTEGVINKLNVNVLINEGDFVLTYGETPSITLKYEGFINGDSVDTEGISISGIYTDNVSLDTIRNVSNGYRIKLRLDTCLTQNYNVVYENAQVGVKINPKPIAIIAGETYEKPVDGTKNANISAKNYVIDGVLAGDVNFLLINYTATLNSSEPGVTTVRMVINNIGGIQAFNYTLSNRELSIPAVIKKLADVTMENAVFDFDNKQKPIVPVLENVLDGVSYYLEYSGVNVQYSTSRQAPKNAGTYKVVCYVHNEQNTYNRAMAQAELTINKIAPRLYFTGNFMQTYGSFTPIEAYVKASGLEEKVVVSYSFEEDGVAFPTFPPAGRHTVKASFDETSNYLDVKGEETLLIKEKSISVNFDNYTYFVKNGNTRNNVITFTFSGIVKGDKCEAVRLYNVEEVKNAGTYRLIVTPSNKSYVISGSNSVEFTIGKKVLMVTVGNDTVTKVGVEPEFTMQYSGFVENENPDVLAVKPSVKLTSGTVGVNRVVYNKGFDDNYTFEYIDCVYVITYESKNEGKTNATPYIIAGSIGGSIALVFLIAYIVKIYNYRSMTKYVAKRVVKKTLMQKKLK